MGSWIPVIAVVIGTILGGVLTLVVGYVQSRREHVRETKNKKIEKLEELYEILTELREFYFQFYRSQLEFLREQSSKANEEDAEKIKPRFHRIQMIVGIYAPTLQDQIDKITRASDAYDALGLAVYFEPNRTGEQLANLITEAKKVMAQMDAAICETRNAATKLAREWIE